MADKQTVRVLRMNSIKSDGSPNTQDIELVVKDPVSQQELRDDDGTPAVSITLRPIDKAEHDAIVAECTKRDRDLTGRGMIEKIDHRAVSDEVLRRSIKGWKGLAGSDDKPLVCTNATKVLLDPFLKLQIERKLFGGEAVEVAAESFR